MLTLIFLLGYAFRIDAIQRDFSPKNRDVFKPDSIIREYKISYKGNSPVDTTLISTEYRDPFLKKIKKIEFYNENGSVSKKTCYLYLAPSLPKFWLEKMDPDVNYIFQLPNVNKEYYNGKIISETFYNQKGKIGKRINYLSNNKKVILTYNYRYLNRRRIGSERFSYNNNIVYDAVYRYNKLKQLVAKRFINKSCCQGNQKYPPDRIVYTYNSSNKIISETEVIDWTENEQYKNDNEYLSQITITEYIYDLTGRVCKKIKYRPISSVGKSRTIKELTGTIKSIDEVSLFIYN